MLSVVICHVVNGYLTAGVFNASQSVLYAVQNITNTFQMALFCVMSGYLFAKAYIDDYTKVKEEKVKIQVLNLTLLYVIWCWILGIFKILLSGSVNHEVKVIDLLMIWCRPIGVFWWLLCLLHYKL